MARRYRRKRSNALKYFFMIILLFLIGILCYKIYMDQFNPKTKKDNKSNPIEKIEKNIEEKKEENKNNNKEDNSTKQETNKETKKESTISDKPSSNEKKENKNEQARRGGTVDLDLVGDENVTVSKGSKYVDAGFTATYSDGSDASSEVDVDNAVDTSKKGTYTVSYSVGNVVIIRRVTVE